MNCADLCLWNLGSEDQKERGGPQSDALTHIISVSVDDCTLMRQRKTWSKDGCLNSEKQYQRNEIIENVNKCH